MTNPGLPSWFGGPATWARRIAVAAAAGVFMGLVGGFGTFGAAPLFPRTVSWLAMLLAGVAIYAPVVGWTVSTAERRGVSVWLSLPAAVVLASVPMTLVADLVSRTLMGGHPPDQWWRLYGEILIVALPLIATYVAVSRRHGHEGATLQSPAVAATMPTPAFLGRIPARLGRDLLCLEMEDHYVRVHTARGSELILMRMRDAVRELDGLPGLQVHRSWWVARAAVESWTLDGRRLSLRLTNGLTAPVSRAMATTVREAGWLT